jgi:hypothetical protein
LKLQAFNLKIARHEFNGDSLKKDLLNLGRTPQTTHHITIPIIVLPESGTNS